MAARFLIAGVLAMISSSMSLAQSSDDLARGLDHKEWVHRAFAVNRIAEHADSKGGVQALRKAIADSEPLVRGFALRALELASAENLRAYGGEELALGLIKNLGAPESFISLRAKRLLLRIAAADAPSKPDDPKAWQEWWEKSGRGRYGQLVGSREDEVEVEVEAEAEVNAPGSPAGPAPGSKPGAAEDEGRPETGGTKVSTRQREETHEKELTTFFTELRERGLEVCFVIDVTLSMTEEIAKVREQVQEMVGFFMHLLPKKVRLSLVTYDNEVVATVPLTHKLPDFARFVSKLEIYKNPANKTVCEGVDKGLERALSIKDIGWTRKPFKSVVILGDAPPHPADRLKAVQLAKDAAAAEVTVSTLIAKPPKLVAGAEPLGPLTDIANAGGGMAVELSSPDEVITKLLALAFGARFEADLRRFIKNFREVMNPPPDPKSGGSSSTGSGAGSGKDSRR
jgi:hypothetical protein